MRQTRTPTAWSVRTTKDPRRPAAWEATDAPQSCGRRRASRVALAAAVWLTAATSAAAAERAKNVILFIGDGMGVSTLTAARIFEGQRRGVDGASNTLSFERFENLALVRTYATDSLVTDSANGASAIMTGHRTRNGALGVDDRVRLGDCASAIAARVPTLGELAKRRGLAVGVVSTAAVTDATPAAVYAHSATRAWQSDSDLPPEAQAQGCRDIAGQLVDAPAALRPDVVLGGGLANFSPAGRRDGRDLTRVWREAPGAVFVETAADLQRASAARGPVLGLFAAENMPRESVRPASIPRLADMTRSAISRLSQDPDGYFLMVEGGLIDKAHHTNHVHDALNETVELAEAVADAVAMTDARETLIIVTADHSHGLTISGGGRETPILGVIPVGDGSAELAADGKAVPILAYATGPGGPEPGAERRDPREAPTSDFAVRAAAAVKLASAHHAGEEVAAYATGPGSGLIRGLIDQPRIFEVMRRALGLPDR